MPYLWTALRRTAIAKAGIQGPGTSESTDFRVSNRAAINLKIVLLSTFESLFAAYWRKHQ